MSQDEDRILEQVLAELESGEQTQPPPDIPLGLWREYQELAALLPYALDPVAPRVECKAEMLARVSLQQSVRTSSAEPLRFLAPTTAMRSTRALQLVAAVLALIAFGLGAFSVQLYQKSQTQESAIQALRLNLQDSEYGREGRLASLDDRARLGTLVMTAGTRVCPLMPPGERPAQPVARAKVFFDTDRQEYFFTARDLEPCAEGYAYRLWFIVDGKPVAGKTFHVKAGALVALGADGMPAGSTAMMVTYQKLETVEPSGERVLYGDESEEML